MTNKFFFLTREEDKIISINQITPHEYILLLVKQNEKLTFDELKEITKLHKSTLHVILQDLRKLKYLKAKKSFTSAVGRPKIIYVWNDGIKIPTIDELLKGEI